MTKEDFTTILKEGKLLKCQQCGTDFRWIPRNSTIKPKFCPRCTALKKFQQDKIRYNKKMLERSNLASHKSRYQQKRDRYLIKKKNGRKAIKTPHERFYKSTAWRWFSRYVLITNTIDKEGITVQCCTCGKWMAVNSRECHLGHYIKVFDGNSTNYAIAFVIPDTGPQCVQCNHYRGGRQDEMAQYLKKKYGPGIIDELHELKRLPLKLDDAYLAEVADTYRKKFYDYLQEHNLKNPWKK